ncbi:uncharacterized protein LOC131860249 [Cryptomeria japonica]|uniref:uncharacterized protein LOC131860249 n=1 Tax=Cryptomeria japonica TaxID=3369 RepID=UPI0027DA42C9|nr:uncharacterized protein LOC131860249 [Cryptomeria japonica]
MTGRVNKIAEETIDKWDIFFVEKEKQEELNSPKKTFKEVNIVVDNYNTEVKKDIATKQSTEHIEVETQTGKAKQAEIVNAVDISVTQPSVDIPLPPVKDQPVKSQLPPVSQATKEKPAERVVEKSSEQEKEKEQEEEKNEKEKFAETRKSISQAAE